MLFFREIIVYSQLVKFFYKTTNIISGVPANKHNNQINSQVRTPKIKTRFMVSELDF